MTLYLGIVVLGYCIALINDKKIKHIAYLCYIAILFFFLCFGYTTGSDWRSYEPAYENLTIENIHKLRFEPGYKYYMWLFKLFNVNFWDFFCLTKCIILSIFVYFINKHAKSVKYFVLPFFVGMFGFYLFIDNPMRNLIAMAISLLSIDCYLKGKTIKSIIILILATTFHYSTLVVFLYLFFLRKNLSTQLWVIIFVLFNFILCSKTFLFFSIDSIFGGIPYIAAKLNSYFNEHISSNKILSVGFVLNTTFFAILLFFKKKVINNDKDILFFNFAMMFFCLYRITFIVFIFGRFQYFIYLFYAITLLRLCLYISQRTKVQYFMLLALISFYFTYTRITKDSRYVPYTNYIIFSLEDKHPSFEERSIYNDIKSPYEDQFQ